MYHPQSYNTHTLKGPPPPAPLPPTTGCTTHHLTTHTPTILQHSYTKRTHCHPPPIPNPQEVLPTILQHAYTKGTPCPTPKPTGSTNHHLTTLIHPQSYNTHTLKGPPAPHPLPTGSTTHHFTTHTPTILQHSYIKGTPTPYPQPTGSTTHHLTTLIH